MKIKNYLLVIVFFSVFSLSQAQDGAKVNHEVGLFIGPTFMQTDYGEATQFTSSSNNMGFNFGFAYIAGFSERSGFFAQHLKLKAFVNYSKANLEYDGRPSEGAYGDKDKFNAMKGDTKILSIGIAPELYIFNISDKKLMQPYLTFGVAYVSANPSMKTNLELPYIFTDKDYETIFMEKQNLFSFNGGGGFRLQFENVAVAIEGVLYMYSTDRVDGADSNDVGDNFDDTQVNLNFGVVFNVD